MYDQQAHFARVLQQRSPVHELVDVQVDLLEHSLSETVIICCANGLNLVPPVHHQTTFEPVKVLYRSNRLCFHGESWLIRECIFGEKRALILLKKRWRHFWL